MIGSFVPRTRRTGFILSIGVGALALGLPVLASSQAGPFVVSVTTSPNPYAIKGTNSVSKSVGILGYATGAQSVALEGYATQPDSAGLEGFAQSSSGTTSNGVFGYAENGSGIFGVSASSTYPGVFGDDTGNGTGVVGTGSVGVLGKATVGFGVVAQLAVPSTGSTLAGYAALEAVDTSAQPEYGIFASSAQGTGLGVTSTSGDGIDASSTSAAGVFASSGSSFGVLGSTNATVANAPAAGVEGDDTSSAGASGVYGTSSAGYGVYGITQTGSAAVIGVDDLHQTLFDGQQVVDSGVMGTASGLYSAGLQGVDTGQYGYGVYAEASNTDGAAVNAVADDASDAALKLLDQPGGFNIVAATQLSADSFTPVQMSLDSNGNMYLSGKLTAVGGTAQIVHDRTGVARTAFVPREAQATVEDAGEAELAGGRAFVPLEPGFANVIDRSSYIVFLTPEGETPGLFVEHKTAAGFTVREYRGASNVAFAYRIVARPGAEAPQPRFAPFIAPNMRIAPRRTSKAALAKILAQARPPKAHLRAPLTLPRRPALLGQLRPPHMPFVYRPSSSR